MIMHRLLCAALAAAAVFGFASMASAADLPVKGPVYKAPLFADYNWTGFYVGGNVGYSWGRQDNSLVNTGGVTLFWGICGSGV
jgi:outer membrane immunogenic protein